ncbi:hypothetical protein EYF80_024381 [Liparis tanakae]|uniref:Uncharacterized protein n=1 Tax=Liparis tanakae TaxID=230148 RepID=A0A4Z2HIS4_9TELE|nr:hypothetical protein EYF80_024381 [Liparis tanakae]
MCRAGVLCWSGTSRVDVDSRCLSLPRPSAAGWGMALLYSGVVPPSSSELLTLVCLFPPAPIPRFDFLFPFGPSHHGPLAGGRAGGLSELRGKGLLGEGVFVWPGDPTHRPLSGPHAVPGLPSHSPAATLRGRRVAPASRWDRPCVARGGPAVVHVVVAPLYCPPYPTGSSHRVVLQRASLRQPPALPSLPGIPPEVPVHGDLGLQSGLTRPTLSPTSFSASSPISPGEHFIFGERKNHFIVHIAYVSRGGSLRDRVSALGAAPGTPGRLGSWIAAVVPGGAWERDRSFLSPIVWHTDGSLMAEPRPASFPAGPTWSAELAGASTRVMQGMRMRLGHWEMEADPHGKKVQETPIDHRLDLKASSRD